ncbi:PD-(D/E)XK nuclease family protein [Thermoanaerobacterium sp. RBIITD]|uniref:PD-(D/E)XK nuclease family protein n=1 Tax=Thermoanaerobacterium sp. RBIITD TaxID=1550240 RepID=UPI000BBFAC31|nr:PD-(D/E)XK nuclease family protein [Thermoanaerobacterium sp. RBIITD]SNX54885.1 ATP-dependent helicase/DNAse subunit B [Thermoanaerobacterium sp. RBIITD]
MKEIFYTPFYSRSRDILILKCIDALKNGKKAIYLLPSREVMFDVREKFMSYNGGISDINIFGFDDLEKIICSDLIKKFTMISFDEINEILKSIVNKICDKSYYNDVKDKIGFIKSVNGFIKVLKRHLISPEDIKNMLNCFGPILKKKCSILSSIYEEYENYKSKRELIDIDDISIKAQELVNKNNYFENVGVIVIDGFINIDTVNKNLIESIIKSFCDIDIYANIPFKNTYNEDFIRDEILKDLLELGFNINEREFYIVNANKNLKNIATHLYSGETIVNEYTDSIKILNSPSIEHEVREAGRIIKKEIVFNKIDPDKIAIYVKNIDDYKEKFIDIFDEMGIPIKINRGIKLITMPIANDVYSLLSYKINNDHDSFINIIASKFLVPCVMQKDTNYSTCEIIKACETAINIDDKNYEDSLLKIIENSENLNFAYDNLRKYIDIIYNFKNTDYNDTKELMEGFLDLIDNLDIASNIKALYDNGILTGDSFIKNIKALETIKQTLNKELYIKKEYGDPSNDNIKSLLIDIFNLFSDIEISQNIANIDGVRILDPDLAKGQFYDVVFILGVNESIFPVVKAANPLFDMEDEDNLKKQGINMFSRRWEMERDKIRFNICIASATKKLYISYRTCDEDGSYMIKSPFVEDLETLINETNKGKIITPMVYMKDRFIFSNDSASMNEVLSYALDSIWNKRICTQNILYSGEIEKDNDLKEILYCINYSANIEHMRKESQKLNNHMGLLSKEILSHDDDMCFSASHLNTYTLCPFKYFLETALCIDIYDESLVVKRNLGSFCHKALMEYYKDNRDLYDFNEERLREIIDTKVNELNDGSIPEIIFHIMKEELFEDLSGFIMDDISNREYFYKKEGLELIPVIFEKQFKMNDHYGGNMIYGKIDRVDLECDINGEYTGRYVIYDYKTNEIKGVRDCVEGMDFQLPTYKMAVDEILSNEYNIKNPECIGLLYYSIKKLKRNGIVRFDTKKKLFKGNSGPKDLVAKNNLDILIKWIENIGIRDIGKIRNGIFCLPYNCPYEDSPYNCIFKSICRYDKYNFTAMKRSDNSD